MGFFDRFRAALLGQSAYQPAPLALPGLDSSSVESVRRGMGGQLQPPPATETRWYLQDLEDAELASDRGDITAAAQLMRAAYRDGVLAGVLSTRTGGLVRLPKRFSGRDEIVAALERGSVAEARSVFDEMCPASELELLARDGVTLGVGVAELVPVEGRDYPVLVRLDPQFLSYRWSDNRWYFRSIAGLIPIVPGDGRWVLHTPGGRIAPWQNGLWRAIGRAYVRKEHAALHADNYVGKLANPARIAQSPQGASDDLRQGWFEAIGGWGGNTVIEAQPGYEVKLLESNGKGYEAFRQTIEDQNNEFIVAVCGQTVTTDGGSGFANADIHRSVRADLIKATADGLAHTVNTQILPQFVAVRFGEDAILDGVSVDWDVDPPKDRNAEASAMVSIASAITTLSEAMQAKGLELDINALVTRFGIPIKRSSEPASDVTGGNVVSLDSRRAA